MGQNENVSQQKIQLVGKNEISNIKMITETDERKVRGKWKCVWDGDAGALGGLALTYFQFSLQPWKYHTRHRQRRTVQIHFLFFTFLRTLCVLSRTSSLTSPPCPPSHWAVVHSLRSLFAQSQTYTVAVCTNYYTQTVTLKAPRERRPGQKEMFLLKQGAKSNTN